MQGEVPQVYLKIWDNTPLFVKYNPGIPDLLDLFVLDLFTNE
jgi:hypothetical protein